MSEIAYLEETSEAVGSLRAVFFIRWMRKAQKMALIEWRDRRQTPGVAARFEESAYKDYGFTERNPFYWRKKGSHFRPYYHSGAFALQLAVRRPVAIRASGAEVRTRFAFGGGVLNLLQDKFGVLDWYRTRRPVSVFVRPYEYHRRGTEIHVRGYQTTRTHVRYNFIKANTSYAEEWGRRYRSVDWPWIQRRTAELFIEQFRHAVITKRGGYKLKYFGEDE